MPYQRNELELPHDASLSHFSFSPLIVLFMSPQFFQLLRKILQVLYSPHADGGT